VRRFALLILLSVAAAAQDLDSAARDFARRIAAGLAGERAAFTLANVSPLGETDVAMVRRALEAELKPPGAASVAVTLSENYQGPVWIAEIRHGDARQFVLAAIDRAPEPAPQPLVALQRELLIETPQPMLDAAPSSTRESLLVLGAGEIVLYRRRDGRLEPWRGYSVPHTRPWPRDLRGRLIVESDAFRAFLPGIVCFGKLDPEIAVDCKEADQDWPLGVDGVRLALGRNYFEHSALAPFFSLAPLASGLIASGTDGSAKLYDRALAPAGSVEGLGSELVPIDAGCAAGAIILASVADDEPHSATVRPFEIVGARAAAAGDGITFPGTLEALWPAPGGAVAISHDPGTRRYAAFRLTVTCRR
jgi:hypothetical protein